MAGACGRKARGRDTEAPSCSSFQSLNEPRFVSAMSRVLLVEDEQHLAEGLRFNLEAEGYQVDVVESGELALDLMLAQSQTFDIVVLDVMLPGKSGFEVVAEMRQAGQFVPTLILTARGHSDDVLKGFASGADDYLTKPFDLTILIARIQGLLRRREWLRKAQPV